ncbi:cyclase family protein [Microbacterium sp. GXF7504]
MLIDLSHPIRDGMPVYPGDPEVGIEPALTYAEDGASVARVHLGSHTGTHVDAPAHTVPGGRTMADIALEELVGDAVVLRAHASAGTAYRMRDLTFDGGAVPAELPRIVLIDTGWAAKFDTTDAVHHPFLAPDAAEELWARGMRVLAVDTLSPDPTGSGSGGIPVHDLVLGRDGLIVENMTNVDRLPARVRVGFFPLALQDDGAPVRGVAWV